MANPYRVALALTAAAPTGIALSQSLGAAGALTLNGALVSGGVATLTGPNCAGRRVGIVSAGNDSALTWTIAGTNQFGNPISETLAGANAGTAQSVRDYATVTSIKGSAATASTVTAGTTAVASTPWRPTDIARENFNQGLQVLITGTVNYSLEFTMDDPNAAQPGSIEPTSAQPPVATAFTGWSAITASNFGANIVPVFAVRLTINSGTGTAVFYELQSGLGS